MTEQLNKSRDADLNGSLPGAEEPAVAGEGRDGEWPEVYANAVKKPRTLSRIPTISSMSTRSWGGRAS